jgi:hypothetical protein
MLCVQVTSCRTDKPAAPSVHTSKDAGVRTPQTARSLDEIPDWPSSIEQRFVLYDLGSGTSTCPEAIHVDDTMLYWSQSALLFGAPKDGSGTPERIGDYPGTSLGVHITSDADFVYWLARDTLLRRAKSGGEIDTVKLAWDHQAGALAAGNGYVYAAMWGCSSITRVDRQTLQSEIMSVEVGSAKPGNTRLFIDGGTLYCGSWNAVYAIPSWGTCQKLVDSADRVEGLAASDGNVYWLDDRPFQSSSIGMVPSAGGDLQRFELSVSRTSSMGLALDDNGARLFHIAGSWVVSFSLTSHRFALFARDQLVRQLATDDKFIYWPRCDMPVNMPEHGGIARMPLDHPPVLALDAGQ